MNANTKYPWDKWIKRRRAFTLTKGKDFDVEPSIMMQAVRNRITIHNRTYAAQLRVTINVMEDSIRIKIREDYED